VEKTGKDRNERRGDDRTEIERKLGGGGRLGLIWPPGCIRRKVYIYTVFILLT
jgi:hypothetical protein